MVVAPWIIYVALAVFAGVAAYSYVQMRKMQKRNKGPDALQDVGFIAEEGTTISHGYGTYDMYPIYTEFFDLQTKKIKKKVVSNEFD